MLAHCSGVTLSLLNSGMDLRSASIRASAFFMERIWKTIASTSSSLVPVPFATRRRCFGPGLGVRPRARLGLGMGLRPGLWEGLGPALCDGLWVGLSLGASLFEGLLTPCNSKDTLLARMNDWFFSSLGAPAGACDGRESPPTASDGVLFVGWSSICVVSPATASGVSVTVSSFTPALASDGVALSWSNSSIFLTALFDQVGFTNN
mmetsp:Transcript_58062/g.136845  ORF Transcript_58062/g.136845 Transcript_58062/m.136845 type:complete len:206 (-) Transcript_58062:292-909(-)